jgi:hypothetical protein
MIYKNWPLDAWLACKLVDGDKLDEFFYGCRCIVGRK